MRDSAVEQIENVHLLRLYQNSQKNLELVETPRSNSGNTEYL